jgi:hypothetical protein
MIFGTIPRGGSDAATSFHSACTRDPFEDPCNCRLAHRSDYARGESIGDALERDRSIEHRLRRAAAECVLPRGPGTVNSAFIHRAIALPMRTGKLTPR